MFLTVEDGLILGPICWLFGKLFNLIYIFVGFIGENVFNMHFVNLSACVILFTIVIRGALFPLNFRQQRSSKIMSFIQPEINKATKKYNGKTDQESQMKKNEETMRIQKKYGVSMTSGCLTSLIQLPIFYGLYRVIQNIPAYVTSMSSKYGEIVTAIKGATINPDALKSLGLTDSSFEYTYVDVINAIATDSDGKVSTAVSAASQMVKANQNGELNDNKVIDVLDKISSTDWNQILSAFDFGDSKTTDMITNYVEEFHHMNQFLFGLNIADAPGWKFSIALIVPIVSALLQFVSTKISMKSSQANSSDPNQQASNKMMNGMAVYMPIMSLIFCISLPVAIGLYWIVGSIIAIITQLIINRYYDKKDKDELLQKCMEKAAKKQAKKKESGKKSFYEKMMEAQAGNVPTDERQSDNINRMASTRLKSYNNPATSSKGDISDRGNVTYKQGSIGSKANIMLQYQNKGNDKEGKK
jgi:YidC/Oxa1 family membrane protein insertase